MRKEIGIRIFEDKGVIKAQAWKSNGNFASGKILPLAKIKKEVV